MLDHDFRVTLGRDAAKAALTHRGNNSPLRAGRYKLQQDRRLVFSEWCRFELRDDAERSRHKATATRQVPQALSIGRYRPLGG